MSNESKMYQLLCCMFLGYIFVVSGKTTEEPDFDRRDILKNVVVHLDLKGTAPKLSYISSLFKDLRQYGANGLLLEYEDMFPFEGELEILSAHNAYDRKMLTNFLRKAVREGFQLIPLVQTFGHMDYVLKHQAFKSLSENNQSSESICPTKTKSIDLLNDILKQIITFHKNIAPLNYFHIGSSEVNYINECNDCIGRKLTPLQILEKHVEKVYELVLSLCGYTKILVWDNMVSFQYQLFQANFGVQPVYTQYHDDDDINEETVREYQKNHGGVWTATAFKGVDGGSGNFPNLQKRFQNHYNLLRSITNLIVEERFDFQGIILTGLSRSRYTSSFSELLSSSIPSLYLNLLLIQSFKEMYKSLKIIVSYNFKKFDQEINDYVLVELKKKLHCRIEDDVIDNRYFTNCKYPGSDINEAILDLQIELNGCNKLEIDHAKNELTRYMLKYYDEYVVNKYILDKMKLPYHINSSDVVRNCGFST